MIDVDDLRRADIALHGLTGVDEVYTLYYDETGNDRRLHVRPDGLNVQNLKTFVLGGIGHSGPPRPIDLTDLRKTIRMQPATPEMKFKHLGEGDFLKVLEEHRIANFIDWLSAQELFIHYTALDPLYWSVVDIVDSIIAEDDKTHLAAFAANLKNDLYRILRRDEAGLIDLYRRYDYPNVGRDRRRPFVAELRARLEEAEHLIPEFNYQMLKGTLQLGERLERLPFLEDEVPNVLIDHYAHFFIQRLCLLKNATHVLDVEPEIEKRLAVLPFVSEARPFTNHRFAVSHHEPGVQVSDVVVGLIGRLFTFVNRTELADLRRIRKALSQRQAHVVKGLADLVDRSIAASPAFIHTIVSLEDRRRAEFFLDGR